MKIIVVSDSHGETSLLQQIALTHQDATCFLHLGDSEVPSSLIYPYVSVLGNNDYFDYPETRIIEYPSFRAFMFHGNRSLLNDNALVIKAKQHDCNFILFGHTHCPYYKYVDGVYILNPGSLSYPRSSYGTTYAIINIDNGKIDVEIKEI